MDGKSPEAPGLACDGLRVMTGRMLSAGQVHDRTMQFLRASDEAAVVCFDYFDTLVSRSVAPQYTKQMAACQLSRLLKNKISGKTLYQIRYHLEALMCLESAQSGLDLEFSLEALGKRLFDILKRNGDATSRFSRDEFASLMLDIEIAVEKAVQRPYQKMMSLLKAVKEKGTPVVIASDFYLPARNFRRLLHYHQIDRLVDHVYISADYGLTKGGRGRLYEKIIQDLNLAKRKILMIGDNPHADSQMADEKGLSSLLLNRERQKRYYDEWKKAHQHPKKNVQHTKKAVIGSIRQHGGPVFPEMGLTLWWFVWKLFETLIHDDVRSVFFLSREGELLKNLFERFQDEMFGRQIIKSNYLLASRKSTYIASLKPLADEDFAKLFYQYRDLSAKDFLLSLNFSCHQAKTICEQIGVDFNEKCQNFPETQPFKQIISSPVFERAYEDLRKGQRENFIRYLSTFDVDIETEKISLVEVGWKGSIQDNIFNIFDGKMTVAGYYVGLLSSPFQHCRLEKTGVLFSETPSSPFMKVYNNNRSLFEMVLGATHGSAEGYFSSKAEISERKDDAIKVHLKIKDNQGDLLVTTIEHPEEKKLFAETIEPIQQKLKKVASALTRHFITDARPLPGNEFFARRHGRMTFFPQKREIDFFEHLYHLENFGVFEFTRFLRQEKISWRKRLFNLKSVWLDPGILEIGFWPPIILRHLGIDFYRHFDGPKQAVKNFGVSGLSCRLPS